MKKQIGCVSVERETAQQKKKKNQQETTPQQQQQKNQQQPKLLIRVISWMNLKIIVSK